MAEQPWKPTKEQVAAAAGTTLPDVIAPNLRVLFVGINPGLYTAAIGHHFGRPGNRFWPLLHRAGFTPRQRSPFEERELLSLGLGITNFVERASASADDLTPDEVRAGVEKLEAKICEFRPRIVAFLGMQAYRMGFGRPQAAVGLQPETICGSKLWVLPNPSGRMAHYQMPELSRLFENLRQAAWAE
ncbi:MAG TPA: G/U mismatch-specific DNA glycosylase [Chloroflexota bacterium]|nr:G/U mismatch-specific DNA glycosylase [Chloroflexota bacterium]